MSMDDKVRITCSSTGRIPFLGVGPIRRPVYLERRRYQSLKDMGFSITLVDEEGADVPAPEAKDPDAPAAPAAPATSAQDSAPETGSAGQDADEVNDAAPAAEQGAAEEGKENAEASSPAPAPATTADTTAQADSQGGTTEDGDEFHVFTRGELEEMKVDALKELLTANEIAFPKKAKHAELVALVLKAQETPAQEETPE